MIRLIQIGKDEDGQVKLKDPGLCRTNNLTVSVYGSVRASRLFQKVYWTFFILTLIIEQHYAFSYKYSPEFNDKLQFDISWRGPVAVDSKEEFLKGKDSVIVQTKENEKYQCILPKVHSQDEDDANLPGGPSAEELLKNVLIPGSRCSYRLEPYWTYEICHGLHVRQYHEEKDNNGVKIQEFYLGKADKEDEKKNKDEKESEKKKEQKKRIKVPQIKIDGRDTPYYNITMGNGTPCDTLGNTYPRQVNVIYICHPTANNEVMNVKETTTCEYELIVLTSELCKNSAYRVKEDPVYDIKCHSLDGSPSRPNSLRTQQEESTEEQAVRLEKQMPRFTTIKEPEKKVVEPVVEEDVSAETGRDLPERKMEAPADDQLTKEFLNGNYCLQGGTGWWKYEFCYGKHINQYHDERHERTTIKLGSWDKEKHLEWVKTKKKVKSISYVSSVSSYVIHYYQNGDFCDLVGKRRLAQVKLKCKKDTHGQQLAIYLLEPAPCEYIIGVESPILCQLIERADENGLF